MTPVLKRGVRIIGIDDGPFDRHRRGPGVIFNRVAEMRLSRYCLCEPGSGGTRPYRQKGDNMARRLIVVIFAAACASLAAGCVEKPTEQELDQMCRHLEELRGEVDTTPIDQIVGDLEKQFNARLEKLQTETDVALKAVDAELAEKLKTAATDDDKEKLNAEYAPKKDQAAKDTDAAMQALSTERKDAIAKAKSEAEAGKAKLEENVKKCKSDKISSDVSRETAKCRIEAKTVDDFWNKCM